MNDASPDVTGALARYITAALDRPLPEAVAEKTRHHILDTLAAMVSGAALLPGRRAIGYVRALGGRREATVIGSRLVTNAVNAALANAMSAHADETDDSHAASLTHPGCQVVPAALAMAEKEGWGGRGFLRAVTLGYDIGARVMVGLDRHAYGNSGRSTHALGPLWGATAAAGALARLDETRTRWLLAYAAQQASGLRGHAGDAEHILKAFNFAGMGARNAVASATMIQAGWSGVGQALDGENGFLAVFGQGRARPEVVTGELGSRFEILATNIKKWSVGSPGQAALDAVEALIAEHGVRAEEVAEIVITLPNDGAAAVTGHAMADLNIGHVIAMMLVDRKLTFASIHDHGRMSDPRVRSLGDRARVVPSAELTAARPERQGIVELVLNDGRTLSHRTYAVRGTVDNPMSWDEVVYKSDDLMAPVLGAAGSKALIAAVKEIERLGDVRELRPLLQPGR